QQASLVNQLQTELAERQAMAAALRSSQERLQAMVSSALIALIATNQAGIVTLCTGTILHRLGGASPTLVGCPIVEAYAHLPTLVEDIRQALAGKTVTSTIEHDGVILDVRHSPQTSPEGTIVGAISVAIDVTEQKQAEEALRQSEILRQSDAKSRVLLDALPDAIYRIHRDGTYLDCKPSTSCQSLPDAVIGTRLTDVLPEEIAQQIMTHLNQALKTGVTQVFEHQLEGGKPCDLEVRLVVNGKDEVLAIVRDISDRKKVDRLKNEFVSTVSHELRTPLTSIRGSLGLLLGGIAGDIPAEATELISIGYKNSERLILLINDILDIEKIESGKMNFSLKPTELMPLVEQAIEATRAYAEQLNVTLELTHTQPGAIVNVDGERLIQVLTNLLSNAAKFSPVNHQVRVAVTRYSGFLRVSVHDQGSGIPEEFRDRIFQKFAQADSSDSRQKGGTGLGLSIAKAIMERLGGQLSFDSDSSSGTTFYCDLPEWLPFCSLPENHPFTRLPELGHAPRILVCEDDSDISMLLKMMLQQEGFCVDIVHSAQAAKQRLSQRPYHAMTLDLALPGQDGISLLRELRLQNSTRSLPIVVVSAKAQQGREEIGDAEFAVIDWLDKPIDQSRLVTVCKQAVVQSQNPQPKILHIEDNSDLVQVIALLLKHDAEICHAASLQQAQQKLDTETFDLILLDLSLPDGSGLELLPIINAQTGLPTPVVLFSAQEVSAETARDATTVLVKSRTSNQELLHTIKSLVGYSLT
ncbi:response regulator, partial [Leptolyngbya sp. FACHB-36]|uniref:response regulator n=1 Tax=Leptolyngbya sp. FACHB-36 TaxID=2692808 RepID=UPI0016803FF0